MTKVLFSCGGSIPQIYLTQWKAFAVSETICLAKNTAEPARLIKIVLLQQQEVLCEYKVLIVVTFLKWFPLLTLCYILLFLPIILLATICNWAYFT